MLLMFKARPLHEKDRSYYLSNLEFEARLDKRLLINHSFEQARQSNSKGLVHQNPCPSMM